jgi:hypothetical protein
MESTKKELQSLRRLQPWTKPIHLPVEKLP